MASSGVPLPRATDSPTKLDSLAELTLPQADRSPIGSASPSYVGRQQHPPLSGFETAPNFELASPLAPPGKEATRVAAGAGKKHPDWSFQLDLDTTPEKEENRAQTDVPAYRIIAVSCRLFINARKPPGSDTWIIEEAPYELIPTALQHLAKESESYRVPFFHIGWIVPTIDIKDRHEVTSILINKYRCVPVYLEKDEVEGFYHGFCKGVLWPLLHYSLRTKNFVNKFKHFKMYERVNERFADAVLKIYRKGDVVWIHDYHLLLTPRKIRQVMPSATVGFFMHSPFPTVELFRQLPVRNDLLEGMLSADVIGFNTYSHCNHHRAACEALLSIDTQGKGLLTTDGRFVRTHISPAGLNFNEIRRLITTKELQESVRMRRTESSLRGLKIVVGRSRKLDDSQGTLLRLQAFEEFLRANKEWRGRVVLLEVVDQQAQSADAELQALVQETVGNINGRHGELGRPPPVHLVQPRSTSAFSMKESCELYMLAHVLMVTPLRDGLSLASHEAVACQGDFENPDGTVWRGNKAPLILSEFAGASTALGGSIIVNPHDIYDVANKLKLALEMTESECSEAHTHNFQYVSRNTAAFWAESCLREITATGQTRSSGFTLKSGGVVVEEILPQYHSASQRLLLLDWDGSVVPLIVNREVVLPDNVAETLDKLTQDPRNQVYIMTGRRRSDMEQLFGQRPNLGLICEHGSFVRPCGQKDWVSLAEKQPWMTQIHDLLSDYSDRTPGSHTEVKERSITWHWRNTDHDFASWTEKDLLVQLHQRMSTLPFTCFTGRRCVELMPRGVSKVVSLQWLIENCLKNIDFVLSFGDDRCDEELFEFIQARDDLENIELGSTPPLGISPPVCLDIDGRIDMIPVGSSRLGSTPSENKSPSLPPLGLGEPQHPLKKEGHRNSVVRRQRTNLGNSQTCAFHPDAKRWTVKVGPVTAQTYASASVESHKDALEIMRLLTVPQDAPHKERSGSVPLISDDCLRRFTLQLK
eukprot:TRINITY_DN3638_c0_g1_i1.p1 TRINITY_DN3638_c0_g1~~TRINITY_DN3638_c0_g1_i1.p1  ORF type:complete len:986 (+),score=385.11 TRINITY_DN3638_c0_g1_i1:48-3005(+)